MFYGSANRDESVFEDPYTFNIDRRSARSPHITEDAMKSPVAGSPWGFDITPILGH